MQIAMKELSQESAFDLQRLAEELRHADIPTEQITGEVQKQTRDGGATIAIAIGSLVVSSISTIVSILAYWHSTRTKYSIAVTNDDVTVTANDLSAAAAQRAIEALLAESDASKVNITFSEKIG